MLFLSSPWRCLTTLAVMGLLSISLGCGGGKTHSSVSTTPRYTVSGTVTFTRVPLKKDPATGMPLGLETDSAKFATAVPAQHVEVRAIRGRSETDASGKTVMVWSLAGHSTTDASGKYALNVEGGQPTFIEVRSAYYYPDVPAVRIIATDIASPLFIADRPIYTLRKGIDGIAPVGNPVPGVTLSANSTVDFSVGVDETWWLSPQDPGMAPMAVRESAPGSGSRILGILDSANTFRACYGNATPGLILDLHYVAGTAWPFGNRPSFVEYQQRTYPTSYDSAFSVFHYFGAIRADQGMDDVWNEAALFSLFAHNKLVGSKFTNLLPTQSIGGCGDLQDLSPDMAILEGCAPAMAAALLKSPYLVQDLSATPSVRDIRVRTGLGSDAYSAGNIAAASWEIALKASSLPSPGVPSDWAKLDPLASARFFSVGFPLDTSSNPSDVPSIYGQIATLQVGKAKAEPVDLASIFTDATLTKLMQPFNIAWPRPASGSEAVYLQDWGTDPNSLTKALPAGTLSMESARLNALGVYPNHSKGEVFRARFLLTKDRIYNLSIQSPSPLPATAQIEVVLDGETYLFSDGSAPKRITVLGPHGDSTTPVYHSVQVRVLSPAVKQPKLVVTVRLDEQK